MNERSATPNIGLLGIGTSVPPSVPQTVAATLGEPLSCSSDQHRAWLHRLFGRSGVEQRGSVLQRADADGEADGVRDFYPVPASETDRGPTTDQRMAKYAIEAPKLAVEAAQHALREADVHLAAVTHLIAVSCTGFSAPGLDVELILRLGLPHNVQRAAIGFMGCHAAFNAIGLAQSIVRGDPDAKVLICCVELCSLHFAYGWSPDKVISNSLFADGAAAAVVGRVDARDTSHCWQLRGSASQLLTDSMNAMTWRIGDHGFEMTLSAEVPSLIGRHLKPWCQEWLGNRGLNIANIDHWAVHPGGPKILSAASAALQIDDGYLATSRVILARHGNMSSTTILFILQQMLADNTRGKCVAMGFGPGLMMEGLLLER